MINVNYLKNLAQAESEIWQGLKLEQQGELGKAISCYRQALRLNPESSEAKNILALALKKQSSIQDRKPKQLQQFIKSDSSLSSITQEEKIIVSSVNKDTQDRYLKNSSVALPSLNPTSSIAKLREHTLRVAHIYLQQAYGYSEKKQFQLAIDGCKNAIDIEPQLAEAYKVWGNALCGLGKNEEAIGYYAKALEIQPDMVEVYTNLGTLFAKQNKWQKAIEYLETSLAFNPEFAGAYRNLAKIWENLGELDKAWFCMFKALDLEPELITPQKYLEFANELLQEQELEKAIAFYNYALRLDDNFQAARFRLIEVLKSLGRNEEAQLQYEKLLATKNNQSPDITRKLPSKKLIHKFLGTSKKKSALSQGSLETLLVNSKPLKALPNSQQDQNKLTIDAKVQYCLAQAKQEPNSAIIQLNLGNLYLQKYQWDTAIFYYKKALQLDKKLGIAYQNLGQAYRKLGKETEALEAYYRFSCLESQIVSEQKYFDLGTILFQRGQLERAKHCFQKAIQKQPNFGGAYHGLGDVFSKQEQWQKAVIAYKKAIAINPEFSWSYHNLGDGWLKLENWSAAVVNYQKAIALKDDFFWSYYNLGQAYSKLFQWQNAILAYQKAITIDPNMAEGYAHLGDALIREENWDEGIKNYEKAIEINPGINVDVYRSLKEALDRKKYLGQI